jgi:hypothetical protein
MEPPETVMHDVWDGVKCDIAQGLESLTLIFLIMRALFLPEWPFMERLAFYLS